MRALQEAGVKIDVVGGRGIGAIAAVLAAVDGGSQLWDAGGFWRSPIVAHLYRWRWPFTVLRWLAIALLAVLAIPAAVILLGLIVYPIALLLGMAGLEAGARFVRSASSACCRSAFAPPALPTWIPRLAALLSTAALIVLGVGAWLAWWRSPLYRRSTGSRLWTLLGSPIDARPRDRARDRDGVAAAEGRRRDQDAGSGRPEPPLFGAARREPRPAGIPRAAAGRARPRCEPRPGVRAGARSVSPHAVSVARQRLGVTPRRGARPVERHAGISGRRARGGLEPAGRQRIAARAVRAGCVLARRDASPERSARRALAGCSKKPRPRARSK